MPFDGHLQGALALICPVVSWGRAGCGDSERAGKSSSQCEGQHFLRLKSAGNPPPALPVYCSIYDLFLAGECNWTSIFLFGKQVPRLPCLASKNDPGVVDFNTLLIGLLWLHCCGLAEVMFDRCVLYCRLKCDNHHPQTVLFLRNWIH